MKRNMFLRLSLVCVVAFAVALLVGCSKAEPTPAPEDTAAKKAQTVCPVMEGEIDKEFFADHEGKRVYFCCLGCKEKFEKEPEEYIKKLEDQGVELEKTPGS